MWFLRQYSKKEVSPFKMPRSIILPTQLFKLYLILSDKYIFTNLKLDHKFEDQLKTNFSPLSINCLNLNLPQTILSKEFLLQPLKLQKLKLFHLKPKNMRSLQLILFPHRDITFN